MKHHTLLHRDKSLQANSSIKRTIESNAASTETIKKNHETVVNSHCNATTECRLHSSSSHSSPFNNVLLSTAYVSLRDKAGKKISMRALLDSGSQSSFLTEGKAKALMLPIEKTQIPIAALGAAKTQKTLGLIAMKLNDVVETNLHVIPKITNEIPTKPIDVSQLRHINHLQLADPTFNVPGKIDILLGAEVLEEVMLDNRIKDNGVVIRESLFGWIVSGPVQKSQLENSFAILANTSLIASSSCTEDLISKFWEFESVPDKKHLSDEEKECEIHFDQTTKRRDDGRFVVELPFNKKIEKLGLSKAAAMKRFLNVEKKLLSNKKLHEEYNNFVREFIDLGHLEKVPEKELETKSCYYLPHHCVLKSDSTTTKLRVVFDASAKTTSGISLNECLMVGPKLQDDIFDILIRFRCFKIGMSAYVAKM